MENAAYLPPVGHRFTKENARQMSQLAWQSRRDRAAKLALEAEQGRKATPQSTLLADQLKRIAGMIDKEKDIDKLAKLVTMQSRIFDMHQEIVNPRGKRRAQSGQAVMPIQPVQPIQ